MAHGKSLYLRQFGDSTPQVVHANYEPRGTGMFATVARTAPYRNPAKDRSLPGKARRRARKAARR